MKRYHGGENLELPEKIRIEFKPSAEMDSYRGQGIDTREGQLIWTVEWRVGVRLIKQWPGKWRKATEKQSGKRLVTAVMPTTKGREKMALHAIECFLRQEWENKELVIVNEGDAFLMKQSNPIVREVLVERGRNNGWMRNIGDRLADGDYIIRWDDDDIHHPGRIRAQMNAVETIGAVATSLKYRIHYFIDTDQAYIFSCKGEGLILYKNEGHRYFEENEELGGTDGAFYGEYAGEVCTKDNWPGLYIRIYHGTNICSRDHIAKRMPKDLKKGEWRLAGPWNEKGLKIYLKSAVDNFKKAIK